MYSYVYAGRREQMQGYQFLPKLSCNFCTHYLGAEELLLLKTTTPVWNLPKDFLIMIPIY
jgi:hypothetical protein